MKVPISIYTDEIYKDVSNIFECENTFEEGITMQVSEGLSITLESMSETRAMDIPGTLQLVVDIAQNVETGLITAYLLDKVKNKEKKKITIKEEEIEFTANGLSKLVKRKIKIEE